MDLTTLDRTISTIDPIDVTRPELFAEDRWQEPFRKLRAEAPIQYVPQSKFGPYWSVTTYKPIVHIESLPVRRQNIWRKVGRGLAERWPRLGVDFRRRACGAASGDVRWFSV